MLVSVNWLKDYVDFEAPVDEFCDKMILSGSNIETVEPMGSSFTKIQVGKIVKITQHPNADKLVVCQLDVGEENLLQIVTGAPNVFEGATVPLIRSGGVLPDGTKIKKGKLRGEVSDGMLCSAQEMGYEDKVISQDIRDGIWILDDSLVPGTDIREALGLEDSVVDFEITPNRPDCLSMIGMARETAAVFGSELRYPETKAQNEEGDVNDYVSVEIKRPDLCPRYTARVIKDVKVGPSPWWMQKRLMHGGMRPVNNIVDITNFVMMEYGQPLHAFDISNVIGGRIIIDTAAEGTKFTTLDGTERELNESMLMIHDTERPIAVAGVMGGLNSEIKDDTNTVILESANFSGDSVRLTSKKLGLRTEASGRYEKGIDANLCSDAADRVCYLIEKLGCGTVVGGIVDVYPEVRQPKPLDVRISRINKILGTDLDGTVMADIFESLEMKVEKKSDDVLTVTPPTIRMDLNIEEDYAEEVARIFGYDRLPETLPAGGSVAAMTPEETLRKKARAVLNSFGLDEVLTYSFVSPTSVDKVNVSENDLMHRNFVKIINPLGEENSVMRTMLIPNMMDVLSKNNAQGNKNVAMFEIGRIFNDSHINCDGQPAEAEDLCIAFYGDGDFYRLKGLVQGLLESMGICDVEYSAESGLATYHPGRCANIISDGELIGTMGEIRPDVSERYGIDSEVYVAELLFSAVMKQSSTEFVYKPLPKYPAVGRDIAVLVDEKVTVAEMEEVIAEQGGAILEQINLFDIYRGKQIAEGKKSVAFALTYRDPERTLTDEEVREKQEKIIAGLEEAFGAELRKM